MAKFTRLKVYEKIKETGLVPLFYNADAETVKQVVTACYNGGARIFEFTNRGDGAYEVFVELLKFANNELPEMIIGVGSVEDAATAAVYMMAGANFIVSPILNPEMAKVCNRRKVAWMPGCSDLNDIARAEELGAEIVKIFPAVQVGGPAFIKSIKAPRPWTSIMPSGGVDITEDNLKLWFSAGAFCVGMGSKLVTKEIVAANDWDKITARVKMVLSTIKELRG